MYYSQHGEDFLLEKIFAEKDKGVFVEVGCVDGRRFSNTLLFEEKGWSGLNIEAHTDYIPLLKKNRSESVTVHAAVCESDGGTITFYADRRGSLSSLDQTREVELRRDYAEYFSGFKEQIVPRRTLTSIFQEQKLDNIDILSIDIEGGEMPALEGLDFSMYKPTVLVIEFGSLNDLRTLRNFLRPHGYVQALIIKNNVFMTADSSICDIVQRKKFPNVSLLHTGNPFDGDPDVTKIVSISTTRLTYLVTLWKFLEKKLRHVVKDVIRKYD